MSPRFGGNGDDSEKGKLRPSERRGWRELTGRRSTVSEEFLDTNRQRALAASLSRRGGAAAGGPDHIWSGLGRTGQGGGGRACRAPPAPVSQRRATGLGRVGLAPVGVGSLPMDGGRGVPATRFDRGNEVALLVPASRHERLRAEMTARHKAQQKLVGTWYRPARNRTGWHKLR